MYLVRVGGYCDSSPATPGHPPPKQRGVSVLAGDCARHQHLCRSLLRRGCVAAAQPPASTQHRKTEKLNRHNSLDMRMRLIITQLKILKAEGKHIFHFGIDLHGWQRKRLT